MADYGELSQGTRLYFVLFVFLVVQAFPSHVPGKDDPHEVDSAMTAAYPCRLTNTSLLRNLFS